MTSNNDRQSPFGLNKLYGQRLDEYAGYGKVRKKKVALYTKRQMKKKYPNKDYKLVGTYIPNSKADKIGVLEYESMKLPIGLSEKQNRMFSKISGYVSVDSGEHHYVVITEKVFLNRLLALAISLITIFGIGLLILTLWNQNQVEVIPPDFETGNTEVKEEEVAEDGIRIPGFKEKKIKANQTEVALDLYNPEQNKVNFVMRIALVDNQKTIYESNMIAPGVQLYKITLNESLPIGLYKAQLHYEAYDVETLSKLNGAVINFDLIVE